jgi:hypothetical protein
LSAPKLGWGVIVPPQVQPPSVLTWIARHVAARASGAQDHGKNGNPSRRVTHPDRDR